VFSRSTEVEKAELALENALVAVFVGVHTRASTAAVAEAISASHGLPTEVFSVHTAGEARMLIYFLAREDRDRVLANLPLLRPNRRRIDTELLGCPGICST
jgi:hypothetical protein